MNKHRPETLRIASMAIVVIAISIGAVFHTGTGSISALGIGAIAAVCPLGGLETLFASHIFSPYLFLGFLVIGGLTLFFGRVFCGWICPVPLVRKIVTNEINEEKAVQQMPEARPQKVHGGLVVLGVTLGTSVICGFPAFCLICPIGLTFATVVALIRLIHFNDLSVDLVVFPLLVILEVVLLKRWCQRFCPLGALLSLFSRFNRTLVPTVDPSLCLETRENVVCQRCRNACNLDIELKHDSGNGRRSDCSKCRECADHCPTHAIHFPWK